MPGLIEINPLHNDPLHYMKSYLLCSGQKPSLQRSSILACGAAKMVPSLPPSQGESSPTGEYEEQREEGETYSSQRPFIDYRKLAIEVAIHIAPDLQETLETIVQTSLNRLQLELHAHADRLEEMEQSVSHLEDENTTLLTKVNVSETTCIPLA